MIKNLNNKSLFKYIVITILSVFFYKFKNIKLNFIFALFVAGIIIVYLHEKSTTALLLEESEYEKKLDNIHPKFENFKGKKDLIDFLFSIQDLYIYNPETYEEMVDNIENILKTYDIIMKDDPHCEQHFHIAENKKNNAINSLHSIIHNLPDNHDIVDKLDRAHKRLETILNKYLNEMYDKCHHKLIVEGRNTHKQLINIGPKAANHYIGENDYTWQMY